MTHKILDHDTQTIIYRSAVRPKKSSTPNCRLAPHGGEVSLSADPSEDKISSRSLLGSPENSLPEQKAPTVFLWITTWIPRRFLTGTEDPYSLHQVQR